jgi:hypothetical protein
MNTASVRTTARPMSTRKLKIGSGAFFFTMPKPAALNGSPCRVRCSMSVQYGSDDGHAALRQALHGGE